MNEVTLPPSPNWYLSTIFASAQDGTVAWGSNNSIVVGKTKENVKQLQFSIIPDAHTDKIHSLAFSPDYGQVDKNLLLSGGQEHIIRVWDLDKMTAVSSQSYIDAKQKVIGVDWSKADHNLICAVSQEGQVLTWNLSYNSCKFITLGKLNGTCVSCSPHNSHLVAIGTKSGLVYIVNIQGAGTIAYKLRGHDVEITSLSWCPTPINIFKESSDSSQDHLLASGAKDKTIFLWKAGSDGRYEAELLLPSNPRDTTQHRSKPVSASGIFTVVLWTEPNVLLASSYFGELISINLSTLKNSEKPAWKLIHGAHTRGIFTISTWVDPIVSEISNRPNEPENWRDQKVKNENSEENNIERNVWTIGQDRQIICCSLKNSEIEIEQSIPTQAGYIYCIASCPLDTTRIAFGSGDACLRLWNLSEVHTTKFDLTCLWQKIMGRIISIAWHPEMEHWIAFGTGEGRVGVYDTNKSQKAPVLHRQHHRRSVYSLGWGPSPSGSPKYSLYSCGDGELVCWNSEKANEKPKIIKPKNCTEFSWKSDLSCLAVGYDDGSLSFMNKEVEDFGKTIFLLKKPIQCLVWHPESTATDLEFSEFKNYLAVATNSSTITVFDMTNLLESTKENNSEDQNQLCYKVVGTLCGHVDRVLCLAWNPHLSGQLVSGSSDGTAQVWSIENQQIIGTYTGHSSGVYSAMWSPLDSDFIMTGSADFSLCVWKISDQKVVIPIEKIGEKKSKSKKSSKKKNQKNLEVITPLESLTNGSSEQVSNNSLQIERPQNLQPVSDKDKKPKSRKASSYFPLYKKSFSETKTVMAAILRLAKQAKGLKVEEDDSEKAGPPSLFGGKDEVSKIIEKEQLDHWIQSHANMSTEMNVWNASLKEHLHKAAEDKKLNDFMVSLAPSLSMRLWQQMCEAYANQLIQESNPTKAVSYLLSIHKIQQAIQVFIDAKMFREAYGIAKCRLDEKDPTIKTIFDDWSKHSLKSGMFEECAQISIMCGDISNAAALLAKRKNILALETAAELAILDGNVDLGSSIADQAVIEALCAKNWHKAREIVEKFNSLEHRLIQIEAFEEIKEKIDSQNVVENWLQESTYGLIDNIQARLKNLTHVSTSYQKLKEVTYAINPPVNDEMLMLMVSNDLALAAAAPEEISCAKHITSALGMISQYEILHRVTSEELYEDFLIRLLSVLEPTFSSLDASKIFKKTESGIWKSLRAYLSLGLLNWLVDRLSKRPETQETVINQAMKIIEESLVNVLEKETIKYWTILGELAKLERTISVKNGVGDEETCPVVDSLDELRKEKKKFLEDRVCVPNPMLAYSKANELCSVLLDQDTKQRFSQVVRDLWIAATSS